MTDSIYRAKGEASVDTPPAKEIKTPAVGGLSTDIAVPYSDYESQNSKPYTADYFKLGDTWSDRAGGFPEEIGKIEQYIGGKIDRGEIANSVTAVTNLIKGMEKFNNLSKEERAVVKIEVLSNYAEFMMKNEETRNKLRRYRG